MKKYILPVVLFLQMALLFTEVPNWAVAVSLFFLFTSLISWVKKIKALKTLTGITSIVVIVVAVRQFNFILSNELIASLLIILTSIRLIEHRYDIEEKPPYFLFLLGLFLAVVKFVFQIDFIFGFYAFLATLFYLYQFYPASFKKKYPKESVRTLRKIIGYSVPITVILFLIFPQLKFDGSRQRNYGLLSSIGASGFSAELRPGSISELVNNENIAFRAEFTNLNPIQANLYWRGQVLDRPQGLMWRRSNPINKSYQPSHNDQLKSLPQYKIILEPHFKEQLFSLSSTANVDSPETTLFSEKNETYSLPSALLDRLVYNGFINDKLQQKLATDKDYYLHLNRQFAKVSELIQSFDAKNKFTAEEKIKKISQYFAQGGFQYKLSGEELAVNSLEDFLFKTKVGFCEHYASAAALLLRYWNVPSRVVVGYQGGEFNRSGKFWTVRQQDAHAWAEYLNEENQWVLYDPITAIAPDRIALGSNAFLQSNGGAKFFKQLGQRMEFFDQVSTFLEVSNYRWTLFFIEYSSANLKRELIRLYEQSRTVRLAAQLVFFLLGLFIIFLLGSKYIFRKKPLSELYYNELNTFFKSRLPQEKNESFLDWKKRLLVQYPKSQDSIEQIFELYLKNRYGLKASKADFKKLKVLLNEKNF